MKLIFVYLIGIILILGTIVSFQCSNNSTQNTGKFDEMTFLRTQMVENQIKKRGVSDPLIIDAMLKVERHKFVPAEYRKDAYSDNALPVGDGQTISQPYIVAFMTEKLNLGKKSKVLEIGTGSGYQAAILAEICDSVFTIEIFETLAQKAKSVFNELGYKNILAKVDDGYKGWKEHAPFDAIIVTCSPTHVPDALKNQLRNGGLMIIPVGEGEEQRLILMQKTKGELRQAEVLDVRFVPMINYNGTKY